MRTPRAALLARVAAGRAARAAPPGLRAGPKLRLRARAPADAPAAPCGDSRGGVRGAAAARADGRGARRPAGVQRRARDRPRRAARPAPLALACHHARLPSRAPPPPKHELRRQHAAVGRAVWHAASVRAVAAGRWRRDVAAAAGTLCRFRRPRATPARPRTGRGPHTGAGRKYGRARARRPRA